MKPRKERKSKKPRIPIHQRAAFSSGHILNDLVMSVGSSYLLTYQTKVLGLSSQVIGLIWLVPNGIDAFLAVLIGFICDNFAVPLLSKFYGRRKSWHLVGDIMVAVSFPFLLMPCLFYNETFPEWTEALYFIVITQVNYMGYCFSHANHLALIPEIAKRPSEMVELGAISSAVTFISGIFIYGVVWALLNGDKGQELSSEQQSSFTHLAIIVISVGVFFSILFHIGTREPKKCRKTPTKETDKTPGIHTFSAIDINDKSDSVIYGLNTTTHAQSICDVIQGDKAETALVNPTFVADDGEIQAEICEERLKSEFIEIPLEGDDVLSSKSKKEIDTVSSCSSGYGEGEMSNREEAPRGDCFLSTDSTDSTDTESIDMYMPETFLDAVPHHSSLFLRSRHGSHRSTRVSPLSTPRLPKKSSFKATPISTPRLPRSSFESTPLSTPRLPRTFNYKPSPLASPRTTTQEFEFSNNIGVPGSIGQLTSPGAEEYLAKTLLSVKTQEENPSRTLSQKNIRNVVDIKITLSEENVSEETLRTIDQPDSKAPVSGSAVKPVETENDSSELVIIERRKVQENSKGSWRKLFKNPMFYKIAFGYMCTRMAMNVTNSYFPMFLTDHLRFRKQAIAYFPLVTLTSGVFASVATKHLNKLLGNKWAFCLGALLVMGSSFWFYSLTEATRSATYAPAILSGCGTSVMFVTILALAAELVDQDRSSGAFVMASMSFLAKVFLGTLFFFLQEFYPKANGPDCPECTSYIHHVFAVTPGVSALLGLIGFFIFIPATVKCKHITHTVDAETQTDDQFTLDVPLSFVNEIRIEDESVESAQTCVAPDNNVECLTTTLSPREFVYDDTRPDKKTETIECGDDLVTRF